MSARFATNAAALDKAFNGVPEYIGVIAATTSGVDNKNTGTPFDIPTGAAVLIQTDADVYLSSQIKTTDVATTATSFLLQAGAIGQFVMREGRPILSARTASSTATVKVFVTR